MNEFEDFIADDYLDEDESEEELPDIHTMVKLLSKDDMKQYLLKMFEKLSEEDKLSFLRDMSVKWNDPSYEAEPKIENITQYLNSSLKKIEEGKLQVSSLKNPYYYSFGFDRPYFLIDPDGVGKIIDIAYLYIQSNLYQNKIEEARKIVDQIVGLKIKVKVIDNKEGPSSVNIFNLVEHGLSFFEINEMLRGIIFLYMLDADPEKRREEMFYLFAHTYIEHAYEVVTTLAGTGFKNKDEPLLLYIAYLDQKKGIPIADAFREDAIRQLTIRKASRRRR